MGTLRGREPPHRRACRAGCAYGKVHAVGVLGVPVVDEGVEFVATGHRLGEFFEVDLVVVAVPLAATGIEQAAVVPDRGCGAG